MNQRSVKLVLVPSYQAYEIQSLQSYKQLEDFALKVNGIGIYQFTYYHNSKLNNQMIDIANDNTLMTALAQYPQNLVIFGLDVSQVSSVDCSKYANDFSLQESKIIKIKSLNEFISENEPAQGNLNKMSSLQHIQPELIQNSQERKVPIQQKVSNEQLLQNEQTISNEEKQKLVQVVRQVVKEEIQNLLQNKIFINSLVEAIKNVEDAPQLEIPQVEYAAQILDLQEKANSITIPGINFNFKIRIKNTGSKA